VREKLDRGCLRWPDAGSAVKKMAMKRLRSAIERSFKGFLLHFMLSNHTGMCTSEQYGLSWKQLDFERRQLHPFQTKNGDPARTIPLNAIALAALRELREGRPRREPSWRFLRWARAVPRWDRSDGSQQRSTKRRCLIKGGKSFPIEG